jgi:hypothetical protein
MEDGTFALLQAYVDEDVRKENAGPVPVDANVNLIIFFF